jgi:hypothetical protein
MWTNFLPKGGIYEVNFGYPPKMNGDMTLILDIPKLYRHFSALFKTCSNDTVINHKG